MPWLKISDGVYAKEPDKDPELVVTRDELEQEKKFIEERLLELPESPSDETLLAWAKENYPFFNTSRERQLRLDRLSEIVSILEL